MSLVHRHSYMGLTYKLCYRSVRVLAAFEYDCAIALGTRTNKVIGVKERRTVTTHIRAHKTACRSQGQGSRGQVHWIIGSLLDWMVMCIGEINT